MENIYRLIADATARGQNVALSTLIRVEGSVPRQVGTKMLVYDDGRTVGTIGGGEMEAQITLDAVAAIKEGVPRLAHHALRDPAVGDPGICGGAADVFIDVITPKPTLLVVGAGHVAMPVAQVGYLCGFRVAVIDDRPDMVSQDRFPDAAERIASDVVEALDRYSITSHTYVVIVTRGHAHDEDALRAVLGSPARYIGMIGSRRKVRAVFERLRADGIDESLIQLVRAPIGLDIGAQTPAEIAVSILAEITAARRCGADTCKGSRGKPMKLES